MATRPRSSNRRAASRAPLETLYALANTLEVALGDVIAAPAPAEVEVVRAGDGPV